jgi:hypothetical protein
VFRFHPYKVYETVPGSAWNCGVKNNNLGFRGPDIEREKPDGVLRLFLVGGSTTWDSIDENGKHTGDFILEELESRFPEEKIELLNCALPGYQSMQTVILTASDLVDYSPDVIVFMHGINCAGRRLQDGSRSDYSAVYQPFIYPERSYWESSLIFSMLLAEFNNFDNLWFPKGIMSLEHLALKPRIAEHLMANDFPAKKSLENLKKTGPYAFRRNVISMVGLSRIFEFELLLCTAPGKPYDQSMGETPDNHMVIARKEHNEETRKVAMEYSVPFVDLAKEFDHKRELFYDRFHMNSAGQKLKSKIVAGELSKIIGKRLSST